MESQNQNNLSGSQNKKTSIVKADISVLFTGDSYGLFIFQKTDKLVMAIYLLSGLMSDREPMRGRLRTLANSMLENALGMSERIWGEEIFQKNLSFATTEILVLFDIAENTKMISKMNYQIITSELQKLRDFLATSSANYSSAKIAFEPNFFDGDYNYVPDQTLQTLPTIQGSNNAIKDNFIKDTNYLKGQNDVSLKTVKDSSNENTSFTKITVPEKLVKDKNNRQDIIMSMLSSGVKLTIKDFAKNIKDCSEKTIQRELLNLVSKGILKKEGERRWSKYFIVK